MANNWGTPIAVIPLSKSQELHINANAEMNGKFFLVLSKFVKSQSYSGPEKNGTTLVPVEQMGALKQAIDKAHAGAGQ
jgi:hypothetical protein